MTNYSCSVVCDANSDETTHSFVGDSNPPAKEQNSNGTHHSYHQFQIGDTITFTVSFTNYATAPIPQFATIATAQMDSNNNAPPSSAPPPWTWPSPNGTSWQVTLNTGGYWKVKGTVSATVNNAPKPWKFPDPEYQVGSGWPPPHED